MHGHVKKERQACHEADRKNGGSEDADPGGGFVGEMNNFQDLQLGSITPVVRCEDTPLRHSIG